MAKNIRQEVEKELSNFQDKLSSLSSSVEMLDEAKEIAEKSKDTIQNSYEKNKEIFEQTSEELDDLLVQQLSQLSKLKEASKKLEEVVGIFHENNFSAQFESLEEISEKYYNSLSESQENLSDQLKKSAEFQEEQYEEFEEVNNQIYGALGDVLGKQEKITKKIVRESASLKEKCEAESQELGKGLKKHVDGLGGSLYNRHDTLISKMGKLDRKVSKQGQLLSNKLDHNRTETSNSILLNRKMIVGGFIILLFVQVLQMILFH